MNYYKCITIPILTVSVYFIICCLTQIPRDIINDVDYLDDSITTSSVFYNNYCDVTSLQNNQFHWILFNNVAYNVQQHYQKIIFLIDLNFYYLVILILTNMYNICCLFW